MPALALLREMLLDDEGATLVEYALVLAAFSVAAVLALAAFGGDTTQGLNSDSNLLTTSGETPP
jgi:Flp pilus assembly pilin Flp